MNQTEFLETIEVIIRFVQIITLGGLSFGKWSKAISIRNWSKEFIGQAIKIGQNFIL